MSAYSDGGQYYSDAAYSDRIFSVTETDHQRFHLYGCEINRIEDPKGFTIEDWLHKRRDCGQKDLVGVEMRRK